jgi:hypothetical protein
MNKIKVIYDVVKKMKDKESIKGTLKVEGLKDQDNIFNLNSVFERNNEGCQAKGKTIIEVDSDGKKMKLENNIDFQKEGCCGHHDHIKHMHSFHNHHHGEHTVGIKEGLNRITAILGVISSIKLEEKDDGVVILTLASTNISEDIKSDIHEMMKRGHEHHKNIDCVHQHQMCMKEFHDMEGHDFTLIVSINKNSEIDKVKIDVSGENKDDNNETHAMRLAAELYLEY